MSEGDGGDWSSDAAAFRNSSRFPSLKARATSPYSAAGEGAPPHGEMSQGAFPLLERLLDPPLRLFHAAEGEERDPERQPGAPEKGRERRLLHKGGQLLARFADPIGPEIEDRAVQAGDVRLSVGGIPGEQLVQQILRAGISRFTGQLGSQEQRLRRARVGWEETGEGHPALAGGRAVAAPQLRPSEREGGRAGLGVTGEFRQEAPEAGCARIPITRPA